MFDNCCRVTLAKREVIAREKEYGRNFYFVEARLLSSTSLFEKFDNGCQP